MALKTIYINVKGKIIEKITGAVLTENNFTDTEKEKLTSLHKTTYSPTPPSNPQPGEVWVVTSQ